MITKGDRFMAFGDARPAERLFIEVNRVAKDKTWADIAVCTWACMWTKRQKLDEQGYPPYSVPYEWTAADLAIQQGDHMRKLGIDP